VTDSFIQYERGQTEITAHRRRDETRAACEILGVSVEFLGFADDIYNKVVVGEALFQAGYLDVNTLADVIFVPAVQGGNHQHDLIGTYAEEFVEFWKTKLIKYSTYSKDEPYTPIPEYRELLPTQTEALIKAKALKCYTSQHFQTHFHAVNGNTSEWISDLP